MSRGRGVGVSAVVVAAVLWGTTGTAATFAPDVGPLAIGAAALGIGGLLQAAVAVPALRAARPALREQRRTLVVGAVSVAVYPLAFYSSMHLAGVAVGTVVSLASAPLFSGLLERWVDGRRLSRWWVLAALLGVVGSAALASGRVEEDGAAGGTLAGVALGLVAGVTYAAYSWSVHGLMQRGVARGAAMGAVFGGGGLLLMPVLAVTGAPLLATPEAFAVGAYMALVPMFAGYVLFGVGLARVPASTATTITLLEPAVAAVLAVVVVSERLAWWGWAGLGVLAVSLAVLALAPTTTPLPPVAAGAGRVPPAGVACSADVQKPDLRW